MSKALCGATATAERYCELRRKKRTGTSGITGNATYDSCNNILTSAAPGRTVGTSHNWGNTDAEKKKHLLQSVTTPLGLKSTGAPVGHSPKKQGKKQGTVLRIDRKAKKNL